MPPKETKKPTKKKTTKKKAVTKREPITENGRPPKYETCQELEAKIQEYFKSCVPEFLKNPTTNEYVLNNGQPVVLDHNKPTITGLALALGFESRQSLYDYEKNNKFSYIIKRAKLKVENSYEQDTRNPKLQPTGSIFALKVMGWNDRQKEDNTEQLTEGFLQIAKALKGIE